MERDISADKLGGDKKAIRWNSNSQKLRELNLRKEVRKQYCAQ
jgi:hypothetical protein